VLSDEFSRSVAANDVTFQVFYVDFCLNATVQHVGTCVQKTTTFSNTLILLFHDRNSELKYRLCHG